MEITSIPSCEGGVGASPSTGITTACSTEGMSTIAVGQDGESGTAKAGVIDSAHDSSMRKGGIDGFTLKVLAIISMTANHVAHVMGSMMPWQATFLLHILGGVTYPIMAFLLVEGYLHTSNLKRYATRLLVFALISQVPFSLCLGAHANVLFTLLMGLALLWAWDNIANRGASLLVLLAITAISYFCDWSLIGPAIVLLFYLLRDKGTRGVIITMVLPYAFTIGSVMTSFIPELQNSIELGAIATSQGTDGSYRMLYLPGLPIYLSAALLSNAANIGYALVGFTIATVCICNYNGKRGRSMKWLFYAYYPAHLAVIWGVKQLLSIGS